MSKPWLKFQKKKEEAKPASSPWLKFQKKEEDAPQETPFDEREQLISDEGTVDKAYLDSRGFLTGGIGRNLDQAQYRGMYKEGDPIPQKDIDKWFEEDYQTAVKDMEAFVGKADVPEEVKAVITNMAFNLGRTNLMKFKNTRKLMEQGKWEEMADEMLDSDWAKQVPNRANRLAKRIRMLGSQGSVADNRPTN